MSSNGQPLIQARNLVKRFDDFVAVDGIDFDLQRGEAFGFLGPNGAGKTSTMRMIGCVSPVTDGTLSVLGMDPARDGSKIRARLGVVPQQDTLDMELTVRENIVIYGRYFGLPRKELGARADELLEFVELTERANDKVEPLSGGMKRRLTIARSLVNEPEVLLLDEPTTGLDPQARHVVWDRLYRLKRQGVTLAAHDALHGRGRAALRSPRRDGSRKDRRRGLASRPDRAVLDTRGRRAALRRREPSGRPELLDGRARRAASRRSRTVCCCTRPTATPPPTSSTSAASCPRASSSAAARSRTSSST